jgi:hypothetical protein
VSQRLPNLVAPLCNIAGILIAPANRRAALRIAIARSNRIAACGSNVTQAVAESTDARP